MADLIQQLSEFAAKGPGDLEEPERLALIQAAGKLSDALENPVEKFIRLFMVGWFTHHSNMPSLSLYSQYTHVYQGIYDPIVIRIAVDLNLVDIALAHGGPIALTELAEKSKGDPDLIRK